MSLVRMATLASDVPPAPPRARPQPAAMRDQAVKPQRRRAPETPFKAARSWIARRALKPDASPASSSENDDHVWGELDDEFDDELFFGETYHPRGQRRRGQRRREQGVRRGTSASATLSQAMEEITNYIPTEVVGVYIAILGLLSPRTDSARWLVFLIGALLTVFFLWIPYSGGTRKFFMLAVLALLGFTAWAAALPSTPFSTFAENASQIGAAAVLVLAVVLPALAEKLNLSS